MKMLKRNKSFFYIAMIFLFYVAGNAADIRIVIDIPMPLAKGFAGVEKYILQGYRSQHIFGINHHIKDAIKEENAKRAKNKQEDIKSRFSIHDQIRPYIVLCYVDEPNVENRLYDIKKVLKKVVEAYKKSTPETKLNFKALPKAYFIPKGLHEILIVQDVALNQGFSNISKLMSMIKKACIEHNVRLRFLPMGAHINFAQITSDDSQLIQLIKNDKKTLAHLVSVKPQKGADKGFDVKSEIHLYDGNKRLATYSLVER